MEPGVTIRQLWQYVIEDGWWPAVVSGTMFVTIGGAASMNIHGKNNWKVGPIGDHILRFTILTFDGNHLECSRESNSDLFHAAIGGFGMFGAFTSITLKLKHVSSGMVNVESIATKKFRPSFRSLRKQIGPFRLSCWLDRLLRQRQRIGQGTGASRQLPGRRRRPGAHPVAARGKQELPDAIMGLLPKSVVWRLMQPMTNHPGGPSSKRRKVHLRSQAQRWPMAPPVPRRLCLPTRLRSQLEKSIRTQRLDPVSILHPRRISPRDLQSAAHGLPAVRHSALPGSLQAPPNRRLPDVPRRHRLLSGPGLLPRQLRPRQSSKLDSRARQNRARCRWTLLSRQGQHPERSSIPGIPGRSNHRGLPDIKKQTRPIRHIPDKPVQTPPVISCPPAAKRRG